VPAVPTARERARRELTADILGAARRQLATSGAAALSVRAVARELGLASSALYRYFATRDDLLTALIVEAYGDVADAVEAAVAPGRGRSRRTRFTAGCRAFRAWAREHPHEYALVHGSPVPGYRGDERTTAAGARAPLALLSVLDGVEEPPGSPRLPAPLAEGAARVAAAGAGGVPPVLVVAAAQCWTALLGLVSSELFGQLANTFDPADAFADATVEALADRLGL